MNGTRSIFQSARDHGSSVKRIVVTSSTTAVNDAPTGPTHYTENDWNDASVLEVYGNKLGHGPGRREASGMYKYKASKTLAERGVIDTCNWDLLTRLLL